MAFDGITVSAIVNELDKKITGGRISKIAQPEADEIILSIKNTDESLRLVISANASLPLIYLTGENKNSPMTAPAFCMLLRKHIQNGRILSVSQPSLERIIDIKVEHLNEMGDLKTVTLKAELMGKHSNIILVDDEDTVVDSIKHIGINTSSLREVLPGKKYYIPESIKKADPLSTDREAFDGFVSNAPGEKAKALYSSYTGISPFMAEYITKGTDDDSDSLYESFSRTMDMIRKGEFTPAILFENGIPFEYCVIMPSRHDFEKTVTYDSVSRLLVDYYHEKEIRSRMNQRSSDLRRIVSGLLEKDVKKFDIHTKQLKDCDKKDRYRIYGELLNTYGYDAKPGEKSITVPDYYSGEDLTIPLDPDLSATDNAKKYFERYGKLKRTEEAAHELLKSIGEEIEHLESIQTSLDIASSEEDLAEIKEELINSGYIKKHPQKKKSSSRKSEPLHYVTKEGFHIYVGKNNIQNEYITFDLANGNDWWFHAKKIPGSHVIVKTEGKELPDSVFEDAARLAAYYSKAKGNSKIEVDYVRRKEVKHPNGSKPGFVVYYTNYSMLIDSDISGLTKL
ncbi:MAG: NFACT family protein [Lachnospiraceae bacterium]|nr:NFACT family protein [Lachnospiraceae bacterium]